MFPKPAVLRANYVGGAFKGRNLYVDYFQANIK